LVPHPVPSEAAQQMLEQPGGTLDGALGEVFVLEPAGDRSQRCVVPGLTVENPSSNSPMRFAASSATPLTAPAATFSSRPHARSSAAAARKLPIQIDSRYVEKNSRLGPRTLSWFAYPQ